jgi:hypothetical protein
MGKDVIFSFLFFVLHHLEMKESLVKSEVERRKEKEMNKKGKNQY